MQQYFGSEDLIVDIEDPKNLTQYLREIGRLESDETPTLRVLHGGVSNKTILVHRFNGDRWVIKQALHKLRVRSDWFSDPARIHVEAEALRYLPRVTPPHSTPALLFEDGHNHLLAMEAVAEPNDNWKELLLAGSIDPPLFHQFGQLLAMIHRRSFELREELFPIFQRRTYFETLRLEPYYEFTARRVTEAGPFLRDVTEENRACNLTLVHGDYSPKNVLIFNKRLVLLDHEVLHFGDPAFDIGFGLVHFLGKALHLPEHRKSLITGAIEFCGKYALDTSTAPWIGGVERRAARNAAACLLARTVGRSPLEYLTDTERSKLYEASLCLVFGCPNTLCDLIEKYSRKIELA
jgi:tRNA A-37 threonylcarbamoyl transferase component Bud32